VCGVRGIRGSLNNDKSLTW